MSDNNTISNTVAGVPASANGQTGSMNSSTNDTVTNDNGTSKNTDNTDGVMMQLDYRAPSQTLTDTQQASHSQHVALFAQLNRPAVSFHSAITAPLVFRDSLLALFDVVSSDYRYVPKDRSAYTVFMQMRRANSHKNLFAAQRDYFTWLFNNDPLAFCILDPIIQVHEGGISFEVFSRDEGCYAQLTLTPELFAQPIDSEDTVFGTTSIDYSPALFNGIEHIRDYQQTLLNIGQQAVSLQLLEDADDTNINAKNEHTEATKKASQSSDKKTANKESADKGADNSNAAIKKHIIEKRINVPKSWIRALLQVQAAGQLPQDSIHLDPIALYNVLFELRMHADIKGKRRGLLIELRPEQLPVIILEPFDITVTSQVSQQQTPYQGQEAKLIRLWGRRRLSLLKRLLPHTDSVSVSILGQGMPSYWTLTGRGFHFTFAMTGFSQANWSQSLGFDLLLPKRPQHNALEDSLNDVADNAITAKKTATKNNPIDLPSLITQLSAKPSTLKELVSQFEAISAKKAHVYEQIQHLLLTGTQQGFIRFDIANRRYYYRPLTPKPLDMAQFTYDNLAEKQAFDLISRPDSVQNLVVKTVATQGVTISADIQVTEDRRTYHSQLQLGDEGLVSRAECSCPQYLQHRLTQGVCAHLIALRLAYNDYDSSHADNDSWHETRVLSKRVVYPSRYPEQAKNATTSTINANQAAQEMPAALTLDLSTLAQAAGKVQASPEKSKGTDETIKDARIAYIYLTIAHKKITIEQTINDSSSRQQFIFNQSAQARDAFLQHIARFEAKGFIENQGV